MTIQQLFDLAISIGIKNDPRGKDGVKKYLAGVKKEYEKLNQDEKKYFDREKLTNPYADSRIHYVNQKDENKPVKIILSGIDTTENEVLLCDRLREKGEKINLVVGHHPIGSVLADLHNVMDLLVDMYEQCGIPIHLAEKIMEERIAQVGRGVHPGNHHRSIDAAKLLAVNLMNLHTPADNAVKTFLRQLINQEKPDTVGDLIDLLLTIPEYQEAKRRNAGPKVFAGSPKHHLGKTFIEMTGGTNPSEKIYKELSHAGISTILSMHMNEQSFEESKVYNMNVVIAGHIASDSLGMNLILDEFEKTGVKIIPCSGLIRVSRIHGRNKKA